MKIETEFPDFPIAEIPPCLTASGWIEEAWHNDAMPLVLHQPSGVAVWLNYPLSEYPELPRYTIVQMTRDVDSWSHGLNGDTVLLDTDDAEMLAQSLPAFIANGICAKWINIIGFGFHIDTRGSDYSPALADAKQYDQDMISLHSLVADPYAVAVELLSDRMTRN